MPVVFGIDHSLDPRVIALERTVGWIVTAVVSFGAFVTLVIVLLAGAWSGWVALALAALWAAGSAALAWWLQRWPAIAYRYASYRVDAEGIRIRRGVVWRRIIDVPRSRVQHTDVSQGPLERRHGLGTLVIHTAGTHFAMVSVHGLAHEDALAIRDHLLPREAGDAV
jgi:hypothetical protein